MRFECFNIITVIGDMPALQRIDDLSWIKSCMNIFRRVETIAEVDRKYRALDLTEEPVHNAAADTKSVVDLDGSPLACDYATG